MKSQGFGSRFLASHLLLIKAKLLKMMYYFGMHIKLRIVARELYLFFFLSYMYYHFTSEWNKNERRKEGEKKT